MHRPPQASFVRTLLVFLFALTVQCLAAFAHGQPTPGRGGTVTGDVRDPAGGGVLSSARLPGEEPRHGSAARPNFLIFLTDDQRYDDLGSSGNTVIQTPPRLARPAWRAVPKLFCHQRDLHGKPGELFHRPRRAKPRL